MLRYVIHRLLASIFVLLGISVLLFVMLRSLPGDPARVLAGEMATKEEVALLRRDLGLDQPIHIQYLQFLNRLVHLDLGRSARTHDPVIDDIRARLPNTLILSLAATFIAALLGIPVGIVSAVKPRSWIDYLVTSLALFGISMPVFWLGLMMVVLFSVILKWLPAGGTGGIAYLIMPSLSLAAFLVAFIARMTRASMLEVLGQDYVRTARSKGLSETTVIARHALKNALIPVVTVIGLQFGRLLSGAVLVETVFAWPGIGRLIVDSILGRDYPMVQGVILTFGLFFVLVNLIVDLLYTVIDPRIRYD
jgi:peptide/nickel transport system permease protein